MKVPTGGGKTFLAVKAVDLINTSYLKRQTGLVLWIVPTTQIYRQTIKNLRNRDHPYRQHLDIASGGRTVILEKTDRFTPLDIEENLVVLMLMLQSAGRKSKEVLRLFKDSGGRAMYWERASRVLEDPAWMCTEASTLNPECLQLIRLVAILALISFFFKKNLTITRRKYSDILWRFLNGIPVASILNLSEIEVVAS